MSNLPQDYENILNLANTVHPMPDEYARYSYFNIMSRNGLMTECINIYNKILNGDVVYYNIADFYIGRDCHILLYCSTSLNYIVRVTDGIMEHNIKGPYSL
jgi:hypothetical protein